MLSKADIKFIRSLSDKRSREEHHMFLAEGRKMVSEAIRSGFMVERLIGTQQFSDMPEIEVVGDAVISRISSLKTPQGVMALIRVPRFELPETIGGELILALDGIQDPGNLGTIIRTADWFGVNDIICTTGSVDCFNPKTVQATMGSIFRVRVHYLEHSIIAALKRKTIKFYGTFLEGDDIYSADLGRKPSGVVFLGNEGSGIGPEIEPLIDEKLFIPAFGSGNILPESLNIATAAAIICSEFRRPRRLCVEK